VVLGASALACVSEPVGAAFAADVMPTTTNGITRTPLGQASPANAPGQVLYLQRVTIAPGAKLAEHYHQGTQLARVVSGVLTYNIVSGTAAITHKTGQMEDRVGPAVVHLHPGDSLVETAGLVHYGANATRHKVVIELAALLEAGAPLATSVGTGVSGATLRVVVNLESQDRTLHTAGSVGNLVYGWNRLTGSSTVGGQAVGVELLGAVSYTDGSGPFSAFVTFTFPDGSTLGAQMQGSAVAAAGGASTAFAATIGVVGGTGRYAPVRGTGTFVGSRTAALGGAVAATFDFVVTGLK
jgi:quercetin dioxygenase-like cupin family protein